MIKLEKEGAVKYIEIIEILELNNKMYYIIELY